MKHFHLQLLCVIFILFLNNTVSFSQTIDQSNVTFRSLLIKNSSKLGITSAEAADAIITSAYTDAATQVSYVYIQQVYQQVKVYNTIITVAFRNGSFLSASGSFVKNMASKAAFNTPRKTYLDATNATAKHLHLKEGLPITTVRNAFLNEKKYTVSAARIAKRDIDVTLCWTPSDDKKLVTLTWNVNIDVMGSHDWWNVRINAMTGEFVQKDNWTVNEGAQRNALPVNTLPVPSKPININKIQRKITLPVKTLNTPPATTSATYHVIPYPVESPNFGVAANVNNPWLLSGVGNNAITNGWHYDGTTNYDITRGNNVFAFLDIANTNIPNATTNWPDTSQTAFPSLSFLTVPDFNQDPKNSSDNINKKFALNNLFYWNNLMHDVFYQYGFNEQSGNFQNDNLLRGGLGTDYVEANAMDGSGIDNSNFTTPDDGIPGHMQMYLFTNVGVTNCTINAPAAISGSVNANQAGFTTTVQTDLKTRGPVTGDVILFNDDAAGTMHTGCGPATQSGISGKIVMIDATGSNVCTTFQYKVRNAQNAGAIAVIIYCPGEPLYIAGSDAVAASITIPVVLISATTGTAIRQQLGQGNRVNFTMARGFDKDGDIDNGVICHEYGHGISNRLTGGPLNSSCLGNAETAGEGWSDYFALMMTTNWNTANINDGTLPRTIGTYVVAHSAKGEGIRRQPYSTNMAIDPITYADMAASPEVHDIGEIWCSALWDMTWDIIQQENAITANLYNSAGNGGNTIALNLVVTGLKLQTCSPGFLDSRDAILVADSILYGFAHKCVIWNAFAKRGMGVSAIQGLSSNATDQVAATDLPVGLGLQRPISRLAGINTQQTITHTLTCDCQAVTGYQIKDTIPTGFTYISSTPAGTLNGSVLSFPATDFASLQTKNFTLVLQAPTVGCIIDSVLNDNRENKTVGGFVSAGTAAWTTSTAQSSSPSSSWFAADLDTTSSATLTSVATAATALQPLSILSFNHYFSTENVYDGGVIEYSLDGNTWIDAAPFFIKNGYTSIMDSATTLAGRSAFSGNSISFLQSLLDLSSLGTTPISLRFRMETDIGQGGDGWYVDDIIRANGCGGLLKTGTYNNAGTKQASTAMPMYVIPYTPLPLTLLWMNASALGNQVVIDWKTVSETDVKNYTVQWSTNSSNWNDIGNVVAKNQSENNYSYIHVNPVSGINYYRIKMNSTDGHFTYSPVSLINMRQGASPMVALVPNPVSNDAVLYISKDVNARKVNIYNAAGSLIRTEIIGNGIQQLRISTSGLAAGIYVIETIGDGRFITKMVVQAR